MDPSESTLPSCSTVTRWPRPAICRTNCMSCSMSMMVQVERCTIDSIRATVFSFSALVIPATGSSRGGSCGAGGEGGQEPLSTGGEHHVLEDGMIREHGGSLELPDHAVVGDDMLAQP